MAALSRNVILLAATSFIADVSGEMLMAVLPFILVAQGAGGIALGVVAGATDAFGHVVKIAGGALSDRANRRKPLITSGYLLAAFSRIGIAFATVWPATLLLRASDRVGKGLRTAPRDAILAESVAPGLRGRAFGLHRAADTAGAVLGVGIALAALSWMSAPPALIALAAGVIGLLVIIPLIGVREIAPTTHASKGIVEPGNPRYRAFLAVAVVFGLANVSYLFFMVRAASVVGERGAVAAYLLFNVIYAVAAYPAGMLADRIGKPRVLGAGFLFFALSAALFALEPSAVLVVAGFAVLGIAFAAVDGTERAFAADLAGSAGRATRLGIYHGSVGLATVAGGIVAGVLYERVAPASAFVFGAGLAVVAFIMLARFAAKARPG